MSPIHRRTPNRDLSRRARRLRLAFDGLESRRLLTTFVVYDAADTNTPGTLRYAINQANQTPGANDVVFALPASTAPLLNTPAPGFDPVTQDWTIQLQSPLPAITRPLIIDGFSQAHAGVGYRYPQDLSALPFLIHTIFTTPNLVFPARDGNTARVRVVLDGSLIPATSSPIGLEVVASQVAIRGMAITGFNTGIQVDQADPQGDPVKGTLIQGNFIGAYPVYPVDANTGEPLVAPNDFSIVPKPNSGVGIDVKAPNTTIGGENLQDTNIITGNGLEGILIDVSATGSVVSGNQIGMISIGLTQYVQLGNGFGGGLSSDGVLVLASSVLIGGKGTPSNTLGAANVISGNAGNGVHVRGQAATRTLIQSNLIGLAPGGGYIFGTGNPGNRFDGVRIENSAANDIEKNTISSNGLAGVRLMGSTAVGNTLTENLIGLTAGGSAVKGNHAEGVAVYAPQNTIGPGNVVSGNLRGVGVYGPLASGVVIQGNLIGTDLTGSVDLGNAQEGVLIQNSSDNQILGDANGSQVISGNLIGINLSGLGTTRTLVQGNFVGADGTGTAAVPNAHEGVLVLGSWGNVIGGAAGPASNLISANHWGVRLEGANTTGNLVEGNIIGADVTKTKPLGNEVNGVIIGGYASRNIVGGVDPSLGNWILFNREAGVQILSGVGDAVLSNSIDQNGKVGIDLHVPGDTPSGATPNAPAGTPGPNNLQSHPVLTAALNGTGAKIQGSLVSTPGATFLIQIFSSPVPDPSGFGEGRTLVGSTLVTTNGQTGYAAINAAAAAVIAPNAWITATATNVATGDTSEFSNAVSAIPVAIQLSSGTYATTALAGAVLIDVQRVGNPNAIVSVSYSTAPGPAPAAIPGVDYVSAAGILTFQPGQLHKTIRINLLPNASRTTTTSNIVVTLGQPSGGVSLGSPSSATIQISNNAPPTLTFSASAYSTYSTSGSVVVTINRSGADLSGASTVAYATTGGTAVPGVDFTPTAGTATFLPGRTQATLSIPVLASGQSPGTRYVGLAIGQPSGGATIGSPSTAVLNIVTVAAPAPPVDQVPPRVTGQMLIYGAGGVTGMILGFSQQLDPSRAVDLGNYGYYVYKLGRDGRYGTRDDSYVAIASAVYNASNASVTLTFARGLGSSGVARLVVNGLASATLNRGVVNTSGVLLSGRGDGVPGTPYTTDFGLAAPRGGGPAARSPITRAPLVRSPVTRGRASRPTPRTRAWGS